MEKNNLLPRSTYQNTKHFFELIQAIRNFFLQQGFDDITVPVAVAHPGMETHLHPFQLYSVKNRQMKGLYLHTSPEFYLKRLLSLGFENIFTITPCFRDEPSSKTHTSQFTMLEWYRKNVRYEKIMDDTQKLISFCHHYFQKKKISLLHNTPPLIRKETIDQIFQRILDFEITDYLSKESLKNKIQESWPELLPSQESSDDWDWDDYFFLLFLNLIEPELEYSSAHILYEYPACLAALSTLKLRNKKKNVSVSERFELYMNGIEIANCFNELTDLKEHKKRFKKEEHNKQRLYGYTMPQPDHFYQTVESLPECSGIALGVERLFMGLTGDEKIPLPFSV